MLFPWWLNVCNIYTVWLFGCVILWMFENNYCLFTYFLTSWHDSFLTLFITISWTSWHLDSFFILSITISSVAPFPLITFPIPSPPAWTTPRRRWWDPHNRNFQGFHFSPRRSRCPHLRRTKQLTTYIWILYTPSIPPWLNIRRSFTVFCGSFLNSDVISSTTLALKVEAAFLSMLLLINSEREITRRTGSLKLSSLNLSTKTGHFKKSLMPLHWEQFDLTGGLGCRCCPRWPSWRPRCIPSWLCSWTDSPWTMNLELLKLLSKKSLHTD